MDLKDIDFNNIQAAEDKDISNEELIFHVPCGAYIVEIVGVKAKTASTGTKYIELALDVAEGEFKNFARKVDEATGNDWAYPIIRAYYGTEKTNVIFKRLLDKLDESNRQFSYTHWTKNADVNDFVGLIFGVVFDEKLNEWQGKISKRVEPNYFKIYSVDEIDEGKYQEPRRLSKNEKQKLAEYLDSVPAYSDNAGSECDIDVPF